MIGFQTLNTEVLIIGAGAAGIRAALEASMEGAEVTLVSNAPITKSGSSFASLSGGWGIQALMGEERTSKHLEAFYEDILRAGLGVCDPKLARILVEESGPRLEDLLAYGLLLRRDDDGKPMRVKGCFSEHERAYLTEEMGNIRDTFQAMLQASRAKPMIGCAAELIVQEGSCQGAWIVSPEHEAIRVMAQATVLATGGGAGLFQDHLSPDTETGDGYALAHEAGAQLKNLEFIQFMLGVKGNRIGKFFPLSNLNNPGTLLERDHHDILAEYIPFEKDRKEAVHERVKHHPFSSRDKSCLVDLSVAHSRKAGKKVFWKGGDPSAGALEVVHMAHAFNGGVVIDERAETSVPGLFAAGEVAAGPHGADRIGGCMMTATQVFGARAGRFAARHALGGRNSMPAADPPFLLLNDRSIAHGSGRRVVAAVDSAREAFSREVMVLRNAGGLEECLRKIDEARTIFTSMGNASMPFRMGGEHMLMTMELITAASLSRHESLGPHFRMDSGSALNDPRC